MRISTLLCLSICVVLVFASACSESPENGNVLILSSTTSVQDSGLLDILVGRFEKESGITVKAIASGSGRALQMGRLGEADIIWVHSPDAEKQFMADGFGKSRITFMHNDFVILGPENDPEKLVTAKNVHEAFAKIDSGNTLFISRGDQSGTHSRELSVWRSAGLSIPDESYIESGQGMGATLLIADEKEAYTLTDRTTYLAMKKRLSLKICFEGGPELLNQYSLIIVNPDQVNGINVESAEKFQQFMLTNDTKSIVENFGVKEFGQQAFFWDYER